MADKGFGAWFHTLEVVRDEEQFYSCLVGVLDDNLELPFFGDAVASPWGSAGGCRTALLLLETALVELGGLILGIEGVEAVRNSWSKVGMTRSFRAVAL